MNVIGVVVEYNPFHNGHLYQIKKIKESFPDSVIIVAMSGHFNERGEVSILSKWDKTSIALKYGVDIVLEIPFVFSNQSSDIFSYAAIKMLSSFKIDTLVFGSESNNLDMLMSAAKVQLDNPKFDSLVKDYIDKGLNYPSSVSKAIFDLTDLNISKSNDILGVSYIKEILRNNLDINVFLIKRTNGFLDNSLDDSIVSASNIRNRLINNEDISKYVPSGVSDLVRNVDYDLFFKLLKYKVISEKDSLDKYHLVDEGINNRIYDAACKASDFNDFVERIKSKRYTYNKINRILINIFLGFTKSDAIKFKSLDYIRLLGLSKKGKEYFSSIKSDILLPVITKFEKFDMLQEELKATILYSMLVYDDSLIREEVKKHVILE